MNGNGLTLVHVTHEATEQIGGIGAVLHGLLTAPAYEGAVSRSIIVGPLFDAERTSGLGRLGHDGVRLRYSGLDGVDPDGLGEKLRPIERKYGTPIVYGTRRFPALSSAEREAEADVLLLDVRRVEAGRIAEVKHALWSFCGLASDRLEHDWDFEQYMRIAGPALDALDVISPPNAHPPVIFSHEYMGMPTALLAASRGRRRFRTVFHAHECATARRITEELDGHDAAFYGAMRAAAREGKHVGDVFGDQSGYARHELVRRAHLLDLTLAVGDATAEELRFLSREMAESRISLCYNGVPSGRVDGPMRERSRAMVDRWCERALGFRPDVLVTHVTRPVISKGLWRDLLVMRSLEPWLESRGVRALYLLLTSGGGVRRLEDVERMASGHGWPREHRSGYPDLTGPEEGIWGAMAPFNESARGLWRGVLVNQFGFSREALGSAADEGMTVGDLRRAADVELGMSVYEPFGIAQLEPLHAGAVCVPSGVCGCVGFAQSALAELDMDASRLLCVADFTGRELLSAASMERAERDGIESAECARVGRELMERVALDAGKKEAALAEGQRIAALMGWDRVCREFLLPALRPIL